jgi:uncharacterized protein involved in exopolysaccharide biosynthesis
MSSNLETVNVEYLSRETRSEAILSAMLVGLWRRKWLIVAAIAAAAGLGILAVGVMPQRYAAEAYIRGEFFAAPDVVAKDDESVTTGSADLDLGRIIETQSRLLQSNPLARRVVQQLGFERLHPLVNGSAEAGGDEVDIAAKKLLAGLSVTNDPHSYLLTIRFKAGTPELAETVTNAFVAELLRSATLQTLYKQRSLAEDTLSKQLAKFGDKHPGVAKARIRLAATDAQLEKEHNEAAEAILRSAGENVTKAIAVRASSNLVIAVFLLFGLVIGVGAALWLERNRCWTMLANSGRLTPSH